MTRTTNAYVEWETNISDAALMCRDTSAHHSWAPLTAKRVRGGFERTLVCTRCRTQKEQTLDRDGYVTKTKMRYPDGYLLPKDAGVKRGKELNADLRLLSMLRQT